MNEVAAVTVDAVSQVYFPGTANEVRALRRLSLSIAPNEWVAVIGSNGAGKSTLLRTVAGLERPLRGRVELNGRDVTSWPEYRRASIIARIDQDPGASTAPTLSIEENLAIAAMRGERRLFRRGVTAARRKAFREALAVCNLGLEDRLQAPVGNLSGGQRQALGLVMATLTGPDVLLLDEHTSALDPKAAAQVMELTNRQVREHRLATLMVTHNMQHAIDYGDRLVMMHRGQIVLDVTNPAKAQLTVSRLIDRFHEVSGESFSNDRSLLAP
ncbi:ABC transporter ATP-binding protein [Paeniglutamicibacter cryotolerans]|uniref:Putative ABC transport system ATP-binding protein n=1 Tax=Paeniglutamicibacter cryotolerans TaxID=670079 RepID=A0A839QJ62_9MICC|nr:ATP-binding cassette domain-containing protein [Paeniglutamicibacter cryotolerans]MBB2995643.1 putative ABC transport system ATP-binding protein [Paeniglutamicibacter cryotolerans]